METLKVFLYVEEGDAAARDAAFDDLLQQSGQRLKANPTLGGVAFGRPGRASRR